MTVLEALRRGVRTLSGAPRVLLLFYAATTGAALLITAPLMAIAFQSLGESVWVHQMAGNLDISWISELMANGGGNIASPLLPILLGTSAISVIVYLFLLGGALQVFCTGEPFFAGCGRNFWRLVRLTLISLLFYGLVLVINNRLDAAGRKIWGEGSEAGPLIHWSWFRAAVVLCLFGLVNLVFDYARVMLVAGDRRKTIRATIAAFRFVWRNLMRAVGLYGIVCAIAVLFFAAYLGISSSFAQSSIVLVLLLFLVRQAMVMAKIWSRLLFSTTAIELYAGLQPPPAVPVAVEPDPIAAQPPPATSDLVQVELCPELAVNAFEFITAWNQAPECRAAAEASLAGAFFDPGRLIATTAFLTRVAEGVDIASLRSLIHRALESHEPLQVQESPGAPGTLVVCVAADPAPEPPSSDSTEAL